MLNLWQPYLEQLKRVVIVITAYSTTITSVEMNPCVMEAEKEQESLLRI